jgi:hypothetical protein
MEKTQTEPQLGIESYLENLKADAEKKGFQRGQAAVLTKLQALLEGLPVDFNADDTEVTIASLPKQKPTTVKKTSAPFGLKPDGTPRKRKWTKAAKHAMLANLAKGRAARAAKLKAKKVAASKKVVRRKKK